MLDGTTIPLQMASAVIMTSPFLCWADKPEEYLFSHAAPFMQSIPTTWDETIVLPVSKIGELAAFARRKGDIWYVAFINGSSKNGSMVWYASEFIKFRKCQLSEVLALIGLENFLDRI